MQSLYPTKNTLGNIHKHRTEPNRPEASSKFRASGRDIQRFVACLAAKTWCVYWGVTIYGGRFAATSSRMKLLIVAVIVYSLSRGNVASREKRYFTPMKGLKRKCWIEGTVKLAAAKKQWGARACILRLACFVFFPLRLFCPLFAFERSSAPRFFVCLFFVSSGGLVKRLLQILSHTISK